MISFSNYNTHSIDILKQLHILPLNKLVFNGIGLMMYKYANNVLPPAIDDMYTENCEVHKTETSTCCCCCLPRSGPSSSQSMILLLR